MKSLPKSTPFEKAIYAIGNIGANCCWAFTAAFVTMYYTDNVGISASAAAMILLISRLFDGVSDIICAWVFKKIHFKMGKIRPWFLVSAPLLTLSMLLMYHVPLSWSQSQKTAYAFVTYVFMAAVAYTIFCLAQSAIVSVASYDPADRSRMTSAGFVIINISSIGINILTSIVITRGGGTAVQAGWSRVALIYAIACGVLIALMGIFIKEKEIPAQYQAEQENAPSENFGKVVGILLKDKYTWILLVFNIFAFLIQGVQGVETYFYRDYLCDLGLYSVYANIYVAAPFLFAKFTRNNVNMTAAVLGLIGCVGFFISANHVSVLPIFLILKGIGYGPILGSIFVYTSDMVDYIAEKHHIVAAETCSMASSIGIKIGTGFGGAMVGWMLAGGGYDPSVTVQPDSVLSCIRICVAIFPAIFNVVMLICMSRWKLSKN